MFLIQQQVSSKSVLKYFLLFCCLWAKKTKQKKQKEKRKKTRYKKNLPKKRSWIHRVEMSLVENVHHYFLCILASTHSFIFTTLSSSSKHQARASSKLFHLIFGNKTPKCKFNVIFFSWFSVMLTLGTYSTIRSMPPPPKKRIF